MFFHVIRPITKLFQSETYYSPPPPFLFKCSIDFNHTNEHTHTHKLNTECLTLISPSYKCNNTATAMDVYKWASANLVSMLCKQRAVLSLYIHILLYIELSTLIPFTSLAGTCSALHTHTAKKRREPRTTKGSETLKKDAEQLLRLCPSLPYMECTCHSCRL